MEGRQRLKRLAGLAATMALVGAFIGCGGSDDTTTTSSAVVDAAVLGCRGNVQVEPPDVVACAADDGINIDHVKWTGWGENPAYGRGQAIVNSCDPYCAAGNYNLFRVVLIATGFKPCQGKQVYRTIRWAVIEGASQPYPGPGELQPPPAVYCDK